MNTGVRRVARSLVTANRWLKGIKTYRFPRYLTMVSANYASSNPGLSCKYMQYQGKPAYTHVGQALEACSGLSRLCAS